MSTGSERSGESGSGESGESEKSEAESEGSDESEGESGEESEEESGGESGEDEEESGGESGEDEEESGEDEEESGEESGEDEESESSESESPSSSTKSEKSKTSSKKDEEDKEPPGKGSQEASKAGQKKKEKTSKRKSARGEEKSKKGTGKKPKEGEKDQVSKGAAKPLAAGGDKKKEGEGEAEAEAEAEAGAGAEAEAKAAAGDAQRKDHVKIDIPPQLQQRDSAPVLMRRRKAGWFDLHERRSVRIFLAELVGTAVFVLFARGARAQALFGRRLSGVTEDQTGTINNNNKKKKREEFFFLISPSKQGMSPDRFGYLLYGDVTAAALGAGIGYTFGGAVARGVSGGHLNPAVSAAAGAWRVIDCWSVLFYLSGQYVGAFLGILLVYSLQVKTMEELDVHKPYQSSQVFGPTPNFKIFG